MAVFAVHISGDPLDDLVQRLKDAYPDKDHYRLSDRLYLVRGEPFTDTVIDNLGLRGDAPHATGAVFKLNAAHGGYDNRAIWEWLEVAQRTDR